MAHGRHIEHPLVECRGRPMPGIRVDMSLKSSHRVQPLVHRAGLQGPAADLLRGPTLQHSLEDRGVLVQKRDTIHQMQTGRPKRDTIAHEPPV